MGRSISGQLVVSALAAAGLSACGSLTFNAEVKSLQEEASRRFPVGSDASAFEKWFQSKGGSGSHIGARRSTCTVREMVMHRFNYCVDVIAADYCVTPGGRIEHLKIDTSGHC